MQAKVGFLFQSNSLYDSMKIRENLEFPLRRHWDKNTKENTNDLVLEAHTNVGLEHTLNMKPSELSGGIRKLLVTNDNLNVISENVKNFSDKFNSTNSLWYLLSDTAVAQNVRNALVHIKITSGRTATLTGNLSKIVNDVKLCKGTMGALLTDTSFSHKLKQTIVNIESVTVSFAIITGNFKNLSEKIINENGAIGTLISDTSFVHNYNTSMNNIKKGSDNFNENMEALKHTWLFKKYFRKKIIYNQNNNQIKKIN